MQQCDSHTGAATSERHSNCSTPARVSPYLARITVQGEDFSGSSLQTEYRSHENRTEMFLAPPALRRRKPKVTLSPPALQATRIETASDSTSSLAMGNSQHGPQPEILSSFATKLLAGTSEAQLQQLASLLHAAPSATTSAPSRPRKHQCRWCIETFEKKWNKDRHEARRHAVELTAAEVAASAPGREAPTRKRPISESETGTGRDEESDETSVQPGLELAENRSFKRSRTDAPGGCATDDQLTDADMEVSEEEQHVAATHVAAVTEPDSHLPMDFEPSVAASEEDRADELLRDQLSELSRERTNNEAVQCGVLFDEGTREELAAADAHISACCLPFLSWLCAPAVTEAERLVKARRVDPKQLAPVKKNLAFLIKLLVGTGTVQSTRLQLDVFTQEAVCKQINHFLEQRQVGASRIYALFLLIKKILVYLSSSESVRRREYIAPNTWNSWVCVDTVCSDSNSLRKQSSRNRKLLGAEQCKKLESAPTRSVPTADDLMMPALYGEKKKASKPVVAAAAAFVQAGLAEGQTRTMDANDFSPDELRRVMHGCLEYLNRPNAAVQESRTKFVSYLVTATLGLAMAPRQQVLRQLHLGTSFFKKADGRYWVVMLAHMNKNGKATTFPVGQELTHAYDVYLATVRPRLLAGKSHDFVFCKQSGDAPGVTFDFSDWTRSVCKELIGRPVNCHAFRSAVVTTYYKSAGGATQSEMNALADVMAHDPATARDYYYKVDAQQQALQIQDRMRAAYGFVCADVGPVGQPVAPTQSCRRTPSPISAPALADPHSGTVSREEDASTIIPAGFTSIVDDAEREMQVA
jgi:hypothetical protein